MESETDVHIAIVGAGVVGLAIAARLAKRHAPLVVLERNEKYGMETSSRNSEVIHAGIYYPPGSLRARLCVEGRDELYVLSEANDIPHRKITKIITASLDEEESKLEAIYQNGVRNGAELQVLTRSDALKLEPNIRTSGALLSPLTGIISVHALMDYFYHRALRDGAIIQQRAEVIDLSPRGNGYRLTMREGNETSAITSDIVINAAGLGSERVAAMAGIDIEEAGYRLKFAKGSYFAVAPSKGGIVTRLIYPVPHNEGLGVHALIDMGGRLRFGPDLEYVDARDDFDYSVDERKRALFGESVRRIVPGITDDDLAPDMSGMRPKLQGRGESAKDFVIVHERQRGLSGFINLVGIDSPGLTASPAIARYVEQLLN